MVQTISSTLILLLRLPGALGDIIVDITQSLVVERFYYMICHNKFRYKLG